MRPLEIERLLAGLFLAALVASACTPAAAPSPTSAPAKPAAQPATAPAKPAAQKPAPTSAPAKPVATTPAQSKATARPEDIEVPQPSGILEVKHAYSSVMGFGDVPMVMMTERLNEAGWKIENSFLAQSELAVEATAKGETQLGNGASVAALTAIEKGAPIKMIGERNANEWVIASTTEFQSCADLDGRRVAIHSEGAVSTAMVKTWFKNACNGTPNYLVIAGSENRAAALINGQIDATPLELADWISINQREPGRFHLLDNFAQGLPDLSTTPIYANTAWAERNRPVLVAWLAEQIKTNRIIIGNPALLEDRARQEISSLDPQAVPDVVKAYLSINAFDPNGGLTAKRVEGTIRFFTDAGRLQPGMTVEQAADLSFLEEAIKLVGRS